MHACLQCRQVMCPQLHRGALTLEWAVALLSGEECALQAVLARTWQHQLAALGRCKHASLSSALSEQLACNSSSLPTW